VEHIYPDLNKKDIEQEEKNKDNNNEIVSDMLEKELKHLRSNKAKLFYNFESNCKVKLILT
jgi:hypothetical protein